MARQAPHSPELSPDGRVASAVDWLGNRFAVGDTVFYCISAGRGQMVAIGEVVQIRSEVRQHRTWRAAEPGEDPDGPEWTDRWGRQRPGFVAIDTDYDDVTVQVRTLKTSGRWDNKDRSKPAWVNPMNITALKSVGAT